MDRIQRSSARVVAQAPGLPVGRILTAESDGRLWAAKVPRWLNFPAALFGVRHGTEMFYYALAKHNNLPMPDSRVLTIDGVNCWATEYIASRNSLGSVDDPLPAAAHVKLNKTLETDATQREAYLRALFLDVMLRNFDRKVGNILKEDVGDGLALHYFDHEQSLGWRANIQVFGRNRIKSPTEEWAEIDANVWLEREYHWAASYSTMPERKRIFESLDLRLSMLDELEPQIPSVGSPYSPHEKWIYPDQFKDIKSGLAAWWEFILKMPYAALDCRLF